MVCFFYPFEDIYSLKRPHRSTISASARRILKPLSREGVYRARRAVTRGFGFYGAIHSTTPILLTFMTSKGYQELFQPVGFFSIWSFLNSSVICAMKSLLFKKPFISTLKVALYTKGSTIYMAN